jgi:hypothetical protein
MGCCNQEILFFWKLNSLKVQGAQPKYILSIQEENIQQIRNGKKEYKNLQRNMKKGVRRDPLK